MAGPGKAATEGDHNDEKSSISALRRAMRNANDRIKALEEELQVYKDKESAGSASFSASSLQAALEDAAQSASVAAMLVSKKAMDMVAKVRVSAPRGFHDLRVGAEKMYHDRNKMVRRTRRYLYGQFLHAREVVLNDVAPQASTAWRATRSAWEEVRTRGRKYHEKFVDLLRRFRPLLFLESSMGISRHHLALYTALAVEAWVVAVLLSVLMVPLLSLLSSLVTLPFLLLRWILWILLLPLRIVAVICCCCGSSSRKKGSEEVVQSAKKRQQRLQRSYASPYKVHGSDDDEEGGEEGTRNEREREGESPVVDGRVDQRIRKGMRKRHRRKSRRRYDDEEEEEEEEEERGDEEEPLP